MAHKYEIIKQMIINSRLPKARACEIVNSFCSILSFEIDTAYAPTTKAIIYVKIVTNDKIFVF